MKIKESEKIYKYFDLARDVEEYEDDFHTSCYWHAWYGLQRPRKESEGIGNQMNNRDHPRIV